MKIIYPAIFEPAEDYLDKQTEKQAARIRRAIIEI